MKLMKDTCSLMNWLMENDKHEIKVGDTFAKLMWSDRSLYQVVAIRDDKTIVAMMIDTRMKDYYEGTEYPVIADDTKEGLGRFKLVGNTHELKKARKYWYMDGSRASLSWGATTGYRDPSF